VDGRVVGATGGTIVGLTIKVNGENNSLAHKGSTGISTATIPDVCKTPSPGGPVPLPYPNVAMSSDLAKGTTTVKVDGGNMAAIKGSEFSRSTGDEPGTAGGVMSSTFIKEATWILYSFDVKLDGKNACRLTDKMFHNHQNTVNMAGVVQFPVDVEGTEAQLRELAERCNRSVNKKHGLCPASQRPKGRPTGAECTALGTEKHKCCEDAINREKDKGGLGDTHSEVPYDKKGKVVPPGANARAEAAADKAYDGFLRDRAPSAFNASGAIKSGLSGAAKGALTKARALANKTKVWASTYFRSGAYMRADVVVVKDASLGPDKGNVKETFDFKFSCKDNEKISKKQKKKYRRATGTTPTCIHHDGRKC
jgi:hypothetical protein